MTCDRMADRPQPGDADGKMYCQLSELETSREINLGN